VVLKQQGRGPGRDHRSDRIHRGPVRHEHDWHDEHNHSTIRTNHSHYSGGNHEHDYKYNRFPEWHEYLVHQYDNHWADGRHNRYTEYDRAYGDEHIYDYGRCRNDRNHGCDDRDNGHDHWCNVAGRYHDNAGSHDDHTGHEYDNDEPFQYHHQSIEHHYKSVDDYDSAQHHNSSAAADGDDSATTVRSYVLQIGATCEVALFFGFAAALASPSLSHVIAITARWGLRAR
jgi:hypothetical protein